MKGIQDLSMTTNSILLGENACSIANAGLDRVNVSLDSLMEALTAVSVAALTIYDMCKSVDREMIITDIMLIKKRGGKSGTFKR